MTRSTGRSAQSRPSRPATSSGRLTALSAPAVTTAGPPGGASSGSSRDRPPADWPTTLSSSAGGSMRESARSALMTGASGSPSAPSSTQSPTSTANPSAAAWAVNSSTSLVFPMPASPPTSANTGSPPLATSIAAASVASSQSRPTNTGLTIPPLMNSTLSQWHNPRESQLQLQAPRLGLAPTPSLVDQARPWPTTLCAASRRRTGTRIPPLLSRLPGPPPAAVRETSLLHSVTVQESIDSQPDQLGESPDPGRPCVGVTVVSPAPGRPADPVKIIAGANGRTDLPDPSRSRRSAPYAHVSPFRASALATS